MYVPGASATNVGAIADGFESEALLADGRDVNVHAVSQRIAVRITGG